MTLAFFPENAVRDLLRGEYKQMNNIIRHVSSVDGELIDVEKSIETAIIKLKAKKIKEEGGEK